MWGSRLGELGAFHAAGGGGLGVAEELGQSETHDIGGCSREGGFQP